MKRIKHLFSSLPSAIRAPHNRNRMWYSNGLRFPARRFAGPGAWATGAGGKLPCVASQSHPPHVAGRMELGKRTFTVFVGRPHCSGKRVAPYQKPRTYVTASSGFCNPGFRSISFNTERKALKKLPSTPALTAIFRARCSTTWEKMLMAKRSASLNKSFQRLWIGALKVRPQLRRLCAV